MEKVYSVRKGHYFYCVFGAPTQLLLFIVAMLMFCRVPKCSLTGNVKASYSYGEIRTFPKELS